LRSDKTLPGHARRLPEKGYMVPAIDVENLSKAYIRRIKHPGLGGALRAFFGTRKETVQAVKDLTFRIEAGEAVGLIGENGAGKSTTMKMLTGILLPSGGKLSVLGRKPWAERRKLALDIGVVFGQRPQLLWDIPVRETFDLLRVMYRIPPQLYRETHAAVTGLLELDPLMKVPVRQLSLGQRMRCDLAAAFLHAPRIAFLDEPTIGLDVFAKDQARTLIRHMGERFGCAVLLTTHDLKDITETCRRVILLDRGSLLFDGGLDAFENRFAREHRLLADLEHSAPEAEKPGIEAEAIRLGAKVASWDAKRIVLIYEDKRIAKSLTELLLSRLSVSDLSFEKPEIEAVVRRIYVNKEAVAREGNKPSGLLTAASGGTP
jgi:ABC-2 type transport system ATP-binding protein